MEKHALESYVIREVRLVKCEINNTSFEDINKGHITASFGSDFHKSATSDKHFHIDSKADLKLAGEEGEEGFSLEATLRIYFQITSDTLTSNDFDPLNEELGKTTYPLMRSYLTDLLAKMGRPLNLPWGVDMSSQESESDGEPGNP